MKSKLAIVMSGGGMSCSYSVGVLLALVQKYRLKNPAIVIGGSGSTGTLSYYVAGQYGSIRRIWSDLMSTRKFKNFLRFWRIIDIDYVVDDIFKSQEPLNVQKIYSSKIHYFIAATNYETGLIEYFSNKNHDDIFEAMRASMAMPLLYNKIITIGGKKYCDSYASSSVEPGMLKAMELGANKLIVIDNCNHSGFEDLFFYLWLLARTRKFRSNYLESGKVNLKIPKNVKVILIKPKNKLKISRLNNDKEILRKTIEYGFNETLQNKNLMEFLESVNNVSPRK